MSLRDAAIAVGGKSMDGNTIFTGVGTDTRHIHEGDLFVALKGPNFDGHEFVEDAFDQGAAAAMVSRPDLGPLPHLQVDDTKEALGFLAAHWRRQFEIPVVGVTGSNGKTTVKEMIDSIMQQSRHGIATEGNLNNDIGVPLTLLCLREADEYAVVEMGTNHPGEIKYLTDMAAPTVAVVLNAGEAHLEGFGSVEAVARAKGEIFDGLDEQGIAVINADDNCASLWRELAGNHKVITFGLESEADIHAEYELGLLETSMHLETAEGVIDMSLPIPGKHNVMNAMAAAGAAMAAGAALNDVKAGLEKLKAVAGRLDTKKGINGATIIDDTYNANPTSVAAGLEVLKRSPGECILVLGDMAELGRSSEEIHFRVGELARRVGVQRVFTLGEMSKKTVKGFGKGARNYKNHEALIKEVQKHLNRDTTVLIKGSRLMHMERVVKGLVK